ncbi:MAG: phage terminase large subunit family protein [Anaerolineae bacterium]
MPEISRLPRARREALRREVIRTLTDIDLFSRRIIGRPLRAYQAPIAHALLDSILRGEGGQFAVMLPRQSGKNEVAAQLEAFMLNLQRARGGAIVKAAPTFQPQCLVSLRRLEEACRRLPGRAAEREGPNGLRLGRARALFFSAGGEAHVVGATADILLEGDEAQDIPADKWQKDFRPMAAAANATSVLWGTAWTADTLLAQTIARLRELEQADGRLRVFTVSWEQVADEVPAYGRYVQGEIARLGAGHPLIRTQYLLQELEGQDGMFTPGVQALMRGSHERRRAPERPGEYVLCVDVGGPAEETGLGIANPRRDATALTVLAVERPRDAPALPRYRVLDRYLWLGTPHAALYGAVARLAELWAAHRIIVDATGVGAGLCSLLRSALGERVRPFVFSEQSKSALGWAFLGICGSGRFQDYADDGGPEYAQFWREVAAARHQVLPGAGRLLRWGVPQAEIHDDCLLSAALCAVLDDAPPPYAGEAGGILEADDVLKREVRDER